MKSKKKYPNITFSLQEKQNGTADAVKVAIAKNKNFSDQTIVICGDTPLISKSTLQKALKHFLINKLDLSVISMIPKIKKKLLWKIKI